MDEMDNHLQEDTTDNSNNTPPNINRTPLHEPSVYSVSNFPSTSSTMINVHRSSDEEDQATDMPATSAVSDSEYMYNQRYQSSTNHKEANSYHSNSETDKKSFSYKSFPFQPPSSILTDMIFHEDTSVPYTAQASTYDEETRSVTGINRKLSYLYQALLANDTDQVIEIFNSGISPNIVLYGDFIRDDHLGADCVDVAIGEGSAEMLLALLEAGFDLEKKRSNGQLALHDACIWGNVECVKLLIQHGEFINQQLSESGDFPLMKVVACYQGTEYPISTTSSVDQKYMQIAEILLQNGSDVNLMDCEGNVPLNYSVRKCDTKMTRLLLENGAAVNGMNRPPIFDAITANSLDNLKLLIDSGANVNVVTSGKSTPLHILLRHMSEDSPKQLDTVRHLLKSGSLLNVKNSEGWSPLYQSVVSTMYNTMNLLLEFGGDVNDRNSTDGATLLLTLTRKAHYPGAVKLLQLGANPNLENKFGSTPLWASVFTLKGDLSFVKLFLRFNCLLDVYSIERNLYAPQSPCQLALEWNQVEVAQLLAYAGCEVKHGWFCSDQIFQHGVNEELQHWFLYWMSQPRSLQDICRLCIRKRLGLSLHERLSSLVLPAKILEFIELKDLLD